MGRRVGLLAGLLALTLGSGVVAQSPSPEPPPWFGGRVEMPEYGFAITVPDGMVAFSSSSDLEEQARQAAAFLDPSTSGEFIGGLTDSLRASFAGGGQLLMLGGATASCTVGVTAGGPVEPEHAANVTWADLLQLQLAQEGIEDLTPVESLALPAGPAASFTFGVVLNGLSCAMVVGTGDSSFFNIVCSSPTPPEDRWLSIAETFEFLPVEE